MKITIIKTAKYNPITLPKQTKYKAYCQTTLQISDPPIIPFTKFNLPTIHNKPTYHSTLKRAKQTANYLSKNLFPTPFLNEIIFDLKKMSNEKNFNKQGSILIRKKFISQFINDELIEKRKHILHRVQKVINLINSQKQKNENEIILISHSFFMKIIEASLKGSNLKKYPEKIKNYINIEKKTYKFGEGFSIKI